MAESPWKIHEIEELLSRTDPRAPHIFSLVQSLHRYVLIFRYHLYAGRDALRDFESKSSELHPLPEAIVFRTDESENAVLKAALIVEASLLAASHTCKNLYEILAQLVNTAILKNQIQEEKCTLQSVIRALPSSQLKNELTTLTNSHWYKYVSDLSSVTKHRQLPRQAIAIDTTQKVRLRVGDFSYGKRHHLARDAEEALKGALEVKNQIVVCGSAINSEFKRAIA
jgi:hypothetical protein